MTYPSPRDGRPINKCWLVPRTREDLAARRCAIKYWADASYGLLGRSPDHVASFFAGFAGSPAFYARGGQQFADNLMRFAAKAADDDLYLSYVIVHPTIDRAKPAHQQAEPYLYAGVAAGIFYAYLPWRFTQLPHTNYLWAGWLPLLVVALVHCARKPGWRSAALFGAVFLMNGLTNLYLFAFGSIAVGLAAPILVRDRRQWLRIGAATLVALALITPFLIPYFRVRRETGMQWTWADVKSWSARPRA